MKVSQLKIVLFTYLISIFNLSCQESPEKKTTNIKLSEDFKKYWYQGKAEISTYELKQNRYGEIRKGTSTLIFVTEDFVPGKQVKADQNNPDNISVLKLNSTKKFVTGVYPYSIMQSSFLPLQAEEQHALKATASIQEWCGQTFIQLNNKSNFEIKAFSYFESEGDQNLSLEKHYLENELWNLIRLGGSKYLPTGDFKLLPSLEFIRLKHIDIKNYDASATINNEGNLINYKLVIPKLKRTLQIQFKAKFPYIIESWSEEVAPYEPTIAKRITTKLLPYWNLNATKDESLRKELGF